MKIVLSTACSSFQKKSYQTVGTSGLSGTYMTDLHMTGAPVLPVRVHSRSDRLLGWRVMLVLESNSRKFSFGLKGRTRSEQMKFFSVFVSRLAAPK